MGDSYFPFKYKNKTPARNNELVRNVDKNYVKDKLLQEDVQFSKDLKEEKELLMSERKRKIDLLNSRAMYNNYGEWKRAHTLRSISMYRDAALYGMTPMDTKNDSFFMITAIKPLGDHKRISANDVTNAKIGESVRMSSQYTTTPQKLQIPVPGGATPNDTMPLHAPFLSPTQPLVPKDTMPLGASLTNLSQHQLNAIRRSQELEAKRSRSKSVGTIRPPSPPPKPKPVPNIAIKGENPKVALYQGTPRAVDFSEEIKKQWRGGVGQPNMASVELDQASDRIRFLQRGRHPNQLPKLKQEYFSTIVPKHQKETKGHYKQEFYTYGWAQFKDGFLTNYHSRSPPINRQTGRVRRVVVDTLDDRRSMSESRSPSIQQVRSRNVQFESNMDKEATRFQQFMNGRRSSNVDTA